MHPSRFVFIGLALVLGGCMLPQPDTPVIPPFAPGAEVGRAQPASGAAPGGLISNNADVAKDSSAPVSSGSGAMAPGQATPVSAPAPESGAAATLNVRLVGLTAKTVVAVPENPEMAKLAVDVKPDGTFTLSLPPGSYFLDVIVDEQALRVGQALSVQAGETRELTLTLQKDPPKATLTEETTLVAPSPSPTATPKP